MKSLRDARREFDRYYVMRALDATKGNVTKASRLLGMNRSQLYKCFERLGIPRERWRDRQFSRIPSPRVQAYLAAQPSESLRSPTGPARFSQGP